ncbi:hypothetical protein ACCQ08_03095 [Comamonas sp. SY3]|uniref:hypothetical protein n=1 Tax=Comamonas sp. SY3 TaxID=3243601 RepID=UPI003593F94A
MRILATLLLNLALTAHAWADKYGIDEAMSESDASIGDLFFTALIIWAIYWLWKKFFG